MADNKKEVALRKRQLISRANRNMFFAVAGASVIVGFCTVGSIFLFQKMLFNGKVIAEKNKTITVLKDNNQTIQEVERKVSEMQTNEDLLSVTIDAEGNALRAIPDALPSVENVSAIGSSLSERLLKVPGVNIEAMTVSGSGSLDMADDESASATVASDTLHPVNFSFTVSGRINQLDKVLKNFELSIRTFKIDTMKLSYNNDNTINMAINGVTYYSTPKTVTLKEKEVKP
jgi:hypothetical protein